jgi:hypothetical protein
MAIAAQKEELDGLIKAMPDPANCLLAFLDDTGDPAYRDPINPVFGLGGCAVLVRDLDRSVRGPWASVRTALGGRPDARLHATAVERRMTTRKEAAVRTFFIEQSFRRVAYSSSIRTRYDGGPDDAVMRSTAVMLALRILQVARSTPFSSIIAIFEHNGALATRIERAFEDVHFQEDGHVIPHEWCWMSKRDGEAGLEVADFIMHTTAGYLRSGRDPQSKFAARFSAIYGTEDDRLTSFFEGESVTVSG